MKSLAENHRVVCSILFKDGCLGASGEVTPTRYLKSYLGPAPEVCMPLPVTDPHTQEAEMAAVLRDYRTGSLGEPFWSCWMSPRYC